MYGAGTHYLAATRVGVSETLRIDLSFMRDRSTLAMRARHAAVTTSNKIQRVADRTGSISHACGRSRSNGEWCTLKDAHTSRGFARTECRSVCNSRSKSSRSITVASSTRSTSNSPQLLIHDAKIRNTIPAVNTAMHAMLKCGMPEEEGHRDDLHKPHKLRERSTSTGN